MESNVNSVLFCSDAYTLANQRGYNIETGLRAVPDGFHQTQGRAQTARADFSAVDTATENAHGPGSAHHADGLHLCVLTLAKSSFRY